jgi:dihydrofolate reductase
MLISLIAAIGKNRELGKDNDLLFQIPEDMKFFREKTRGHTVIMGRKTYESIGRPLPNRTNIIISRSLDVNIQSSEVKIVYSIEEALELAKTIEKEEIFVIGGAQIYALALPFADKLYLTLVNKEVKDADAFFPDYSGFNKIISQRKSKDENYEYEFLELSRN